MEGEFVRFFYQAAADHVANVAAEIALYDALGAVRAMRAGEILWLTDVATMGTAAGVAPRRDWLYDDPDNSGRTDANTICGIRGQFYLLRRLGFNHPCPVRRLMRIGEFDFDAGKPFYWWGHGLIRSA